MRNGFVKLNDINILIMDVGEVCKMIFIIDSKLLLKKICMKIQFSGYMLGMCKGLILIVCVLIFCVKFVRKI